MTSHESSLHGDFSGRDHVPHVLGLSVYFMTWGALVVLTGITVAASYLNLGSWNLVVALAIATAKALAVATIFMHLWFDHRFHAIIFGSALVFLGIFIGLTMIDTETRGKSDVALADRPVDIANPFGETRSQAAMRARYGKKSETAPPAQSDHAGPPAQSDHAGPPAQSDHAGPPAQSDHATAPAK
jgi:cytochrome c oxidase subunit IV